MYSVPRSTPMTAEAAEAVVEKRKKRPRSMAPGERLPLRRPGGAMMCGVVREAKGVVNGRRGEVVVGCACFAAGKKGGRLYVAVENLDRREESDRESIPGKKR